MSDLARLMLPSLDPLHSECVPSEAQQDDFNHSTSPSHTRTSHSRANSHFRVAALLSQQAQYSLIQQISEQDLSVESKLKIVGDISLLLLPDAILSSRQDTEHGMMEPHRVTMESNTTRKVVSTLNGWVSSWVDAHDLPVSASVPSDVILHVLALAGTGMAPITLPLSWLHSIVTSNQSRENLTQVAIKQHNSKVMNEVQTSPQRMRFAERTEQWWLWPYVIKGLQYAQNQSGAPALVIDVNNWALSSITTLMDSETPAKCDLDSLARSCISLSASEEVLRQLCYKLAEVAVSGHAIGVNGKDGQQAMGQGLGLWHLKSIMKQLSTRSSPGSPPHDFLSVWGTAALPSNLPPATQKMMDMVLSRHSDPSVAPFTPLLSGARLAALCNRMYPDVYPHTAASTERSQIFCFLPAGLDSQSDPGTIKELSHKVPSRDESHVSSSSISCQSSGWIDMFALARMTQLGVQSGTIEAFKALDLIKSICTWTKLQIDVYKDRGTSADPDFEPRSPESIESRSPESIESRSPESIESRSPESIESRSPESFEPRSPESNAGVGKKISAVNDSEVKSELQNLSCVAAQALHACAAVRDKSSSLPHVEEAAKAAASVLWEDIGDMVLGCLPHLSPGVVLPLAIALSKLEISKGLMGLTDFLSTKYGSLPSLNKLPHLASALVRKKNAILTTDMLWSLALLHQWPRVLSALPLLPGMDSSVLEASLCIIGTRRAPLATWEELDMTLAAIEGGGAKTKSRKVLCAAIDAQVRHAAVTGSTSGLVDHRLSLRSREDAVLLLGTLKRLNCLGFEETPRFVALRSNAILDLLDKAGQYQLLRLICSPRFAQPYGHPSASASEAVSPSSLPTRSVTAAAGALGASLCNLDPETYPKMPPRITSPSLVVQMSVIKSIDEAAATILKRLIKEVQGVTKAGPEEVHDVGLSSLLHALKDYVDHVNSRFVSASLYYGLNQQEHRAAQLANVERVSQCIQSLLSPSRGCDVPLMDKQALLIALCSWQQLPHAQAACVLVRDLMSEMALSLPPQKQALESRMFAETLTSLVISAGTLLCFEGCTSSTHNGSQTVDRLFETACQFLLSLESEAAACLDDEAHPPDEMLKILAAYSQLYRDVARFGARPSPWRPWSHQALRVLRSSSSHPHSSALIALYVGLDEETVLALVDSHLNEINCNPDPHQSGNARRWHNQYLHLVSAVAFRLRNMYQFNQHRQSSPGDHSNVHLAASNNTSASDNNPGSCTLGMLDQQIALMEDILSHLLQCMQTAQDLTAGAQATNLDLTFLQAVTPLLFSCDNKTTVHSRVPQALRDQIDEAVEAVMQQWTSKIGNMTSMDIQDRGLFSLHHDGLASILVQDKTQSIPSCKEGLTSINLFGDDVIQALRIFEPFLVDMRPSGRLLLDTLTNALRAVLVDGKRVRGTTGGVGILSGPQIAGIMYQYARVMHPNPRLLEEFLLPLSFALKLGDDARTYILDAHGLERHPLILATEAFAMSAPLQRFSQRSLNRLLNLLDRYWCSSEGRPGVVCPPALSLNHAVDLLISSASIYFHIKPRAGLPQDPDCEWIPPHLTMVMAKVSRAAAQLSPQQLAPITHLAWMLCKENVPSSDVLWAAATDALIAGAAHSMSPVDLAELLCAVKDLDVMLSEPLSSSLLTALPTMSFDELEIGVLQKLWATLAFALEKRAVLVKADTKKNEKFKIERCSIGDVGPGHKELHKDIWPKSDKPLASHDVLETAANCIKEILQRKSAPALLEFGATAPFQTHTLGLYFLYTHLSRRFSRYSRICRSRNLADARVIQQKAADTRLQKSVHVLRSYVQSSGCHPWALQELADALSVDLWRD
ncbi:hypothetical protein CEUSTIGMA_g10481.t1 [Chlamydomonas eustigma]|uniref:Uncharacterized protein n=1 Tax=Chlamydomonas eustigma TaxID=1157962 RepID=A0A250XIZ8_9CHLO|nr:hypothetical protein CEUSTIGMA_g10481.t1 [Chlamydomonas eustigma]|eukprot:GAX83055.1 hypothetical protein CEUSTIGMA_g10481.t1 [Chlamydomonas eustigma]